VRTRPILVAIALATLLLAACERTTGPTLPLPPPVVEAIAAPVGGFVTITGIAQEFAIVYAWNETQEEGGIVRADATGRFAIVIPGASGDGLVVWYDDGTDRSEPTMTSIP